MKEAEEKQLLDYRRRVIPTREGTFTGNSARGMQGERESSRRARAFRKKDIYGHLLALLKEGDASVPSLLAAASFVCVIMCWFPSLTS